ncbi:uncharacterized protein BT62DRAFT_1005249 [Guyanagaster necrorhizus]|uniref:Uncharacterized protein n=1 Tax=Guyanagaster necrorhizus TaxID=856835 RepID=A0A9P8ATC8_9AGAR|nr:uncharacterized protein BT62DRAFT_1005249 [Guyanagaster necrorhizus MCA 3950]KAG7446856.1 hypothetical protein BT62DRAFT_1005249 [Guyanagaster necrorhizus MCA 3950]
MEEEYMEAVESYLEWQGEEQKEELERKREEVWQAAERWAKEMEEALREAAQREAEEREATEAAARASVSEVEEKEMVTEDRLQMTLTKAIDFQLHQVLAEQFSPSLSLHFKKVTGHMPLESNGLDHQE